MALGPKKTGIQLAHSREPCARTIPTERLRHRSDKPNFSGTVPVAPAFGHLTGIVRRNRFEGVQRVDPIDEVSRRNDIVKIPAVGFSNVHILNKAHYAAGMTEMFRQIQNGVFVEAATNHRIDLDV